MLIVAVMAWVLPLFPGEPKLGPIANRIDRFVPLPFPLLLVVPGLAMDLFRHWIGQGRGWWRDWLIVFGCAVIFLALFLATQWHFSEFLLSSGADNWFFAADRHWGFGEGPGEWRKQFWNELRPQNHSGVTWPALGKALLASLIASRLGLSLGNWMVKVRR